MATGLDALFAAIRGACSSAVWSQGVELARAGAVHGEREDDGAVVLRVATRGGLVSPSVHFELDPPDWNCDCASREAHQAAIARPGDRIVIAAAAPQSTDFRTNLIKIDRIPRP